MLTSKGNRKKNASRVRLVCARNPVLSSLPHLLKRAFPIMETNQRLKSLFDLPLVLFGRPKNLRDLLVQRRPTPSHSKTAPPGTYPCASATCKTCAQVKKKLTKISFKSGKKSSKQAVSRRFTCESASVIDLLSWPTCNAAYVGETGCKLRERLNHHQSNHP